MDVIVESDKIDQLVAAAQFRRGTAGDHVARSKLTLVISLRHCDILWRRLFCDEVDHRIDMTNADARIDRTHRLDRSNAGADELTLHLVASPMREREKESRLTSGKGKEGDLVDWTDERLLKIFGEQSGRSFSEGDKAFDKFRTQNVESVGPAVVPEIPNYLHIG